MDWSNGKKYYQPKLANWLGSSTKGLTERFGWVGKWYWWFTLSGRSGYIYHKKKLRMATRSLHGITSKQAIVKHGFWIGPVLLTLKNNAYDI